MRQCTAMLGQLGSAVAQAATAGNCAISAACRAGSNCSIVAAALGRVRFKLVTANAGHARSGGTEAPKGCLSSGKCLLCEQCQLMHRQKAQRMQATPLLSSPAAVIGCVLPRLGILEPTWEEFYGDDEGSEAKPFEEFFVQDNEDMDIFSDMVRRTTGSGYMLSLMCCMCRLCGVGTCAAAAQTHFSTAAAHAPYGSAMLPHLLWCSCPIPV